MKNRKRNPVIIKIYISIPKNKFKGIIVTKGLENLKGN